MWRPISGRLVNVFSSTKHMACLAHLGWLASWVATAPPRDLKPTLPQCNFQVICNADIICWQSLLLQNHPQRLTMTSGQISYFRWYVCVTVLSYNTHLPNTIILLRSMSFLSRRYSKADLASIYNPTIERPYLILIITRRELKCHLNWICLTTNLLGHLNYQTAKISCLKKK